GIDTDRDDLKGRSDTMILAVLNTKLKTLKLVSFMRDLYVKIPGKGHNKLNASYAFGGASLVKRTLEDNFGIIVDGYLAINFSLMANLVDAIGGIEIFVEEYELKPLNGILGYFNYQRGVPEDQGMLAASGSRVLTGLQTMSYARIRKTDSDFERIVRQQKVIEAIYLQLRQASLPQLIDAVTAFISKVGTDVSMSDVLSLLTETMKIDEISIETLSIPVKGTFSAKMINKTYFLVPNSKRNISAISEFLYAQPDKQTVD
ncbi:MAG: LCP family protein, partial [Clostridiales bacterium]|nr:LCP family protein [Clostridiales bacterium]